jgi:fatty-acyl-CoA synthase
MSEVLSYLSGPTDQSLINLTIGEVLKRAVRQDPDQEAIVSLHQNIRLTYQQLDTASDSFAKGLSELGLEIGDRIGIWSPNYLEWIITMYAASKLGLILVNVNPAYRPHELEYALNKVECKALVLARSFKTSDYPVILEKVAPEISGSRIGHLNAERIPSLKTLVLISDVQRDGYARFNDLVVTGATSSFDLGAVEAVVKCDMPVNIQFTSGTTGAPKGATLTHYNIVNNGSNVGDGIKLTAKDRVCTPVPLYHCFGMVMATLACASHGATLVLPNDAFEPAGTLDAVQKEKCTALYGVPTMFGAMLEEADFDTYDLGSLRTGIVAGSLCAETLMTRIVEQMHMSEVTNCYGMTETSPVSFQSATDDPMEKRVKTVGTVHPHVEVKVVDDKGEIVPRGVPGELCTKGYSVMQGYWNDPQKTTESIIDGWMFTGDQAVIDEDGYCAIVGRIKDTIIRGGENIAPKEIEDYLISHPAIVEAQAFGVPDQKFGEVVAVWIKVNQGSELSEQDVRDYCIDQIAYFKVPTMVRFVDEYPMTVTGKIQKYKMRDLMEQEAS